MHYKKKKKKMSILLIFSYSVSKYEMKKCLNGEQQIK